MEIHLTPKGETYRGVARAIKVLVSVVVIASIIVLARIVFLFFGQLSTLPGYQFIKDLSGIITAPFNSVGTVKTPYSGEFDIGATVLLMVLIFIEFVLSGIANFFSRRALSETVGREQTQTPNVQVLVSPTINGAPAEAPIDPSLITQVVPAPGREDSSELKETVEADKSK
ncbi:MAG TPA: hypothetical protein ENH19_01620 [Actinobacteria bacterium]|nr:hypothetical protein [Actinomycetes bacterium]HEX21336.1 hypothetical protein [Actinomycetota bacterium]